MWQFVSSDRHLVDRRALVYLQMLITSTRSEFFFWEGGWQAVSLGGGVTVMESRKFW